MKWLKKVFSKIFKNLHSVCCSIFLSVLIVLLTTMSAQYLGDVMSNKILINKPVEILFFIDNSNQKESAYAKELVKTMNNNSDLKKYHIKIKQLNANQSLSLNENEKIIFSMQKKVMDNLSTAKKLAILNRSIFDNRTQKYLIYSKYDEYVLAETNNNFKVYIGLLNTKTNIKKIKIFKTLNAISSSVLRKIDLQPDA